MHTILRSAATEVKIKVAPRQRAAQEAVQSTIVDQIVVRDWQLNIDADMVLRGQIADAASIRQSKTN